MIKRFNRFELKHVISGQLRDALLREVAQRMPADTAFQPSGRYLVTSLYFDSRDLAFYRAKLDGIRYRRKLRIRLYGQPGEAPDPEVMVEIKQRIARTTQKRRIALPLSQAHLLCTGRLELSLADPRDRDVAQEVEFLARSLQLRPVCVVAYRRQAFQGGPYDLGLRVTFDDDLTCSPPSSRLVDGSPRFRLLSPDRVILEIKANDCIPDWVAGLLASHSCPLDRFSKYCNAVAAMHERAESALAS